MNLMATIDEAKLNQKLDPKLRDTICLNARTGWATRWGQDPMGVTLVMMVRNLNGVDYGTAITPVQPFYSCTREPDWLSLSRGVVSVSEMTSFIQNTFKLNIKQLAGILHVTRATVYEWMKPQEKSSLKEETRKRLLDVYQVAKEWAQLPQIDGTFAHEIIEPLGRSLEDLLKSKTLDPVSICQANGALTYQACRKQAQIKELSRQRKSLLKAGEEIETNAAALGVVID